MAAAWLYPEQFTSFENVMAYIAKNFWHASASGVASVVASTCADISMPEGTKFGADNISADYEKTIDAFIDEGNIYYLGNYAAIDKATDNDLQTYSYATLAKRYAQTLISAATEAAQKQATAEDTAAKATAAAKAAQQAASAVNAASVNKATVKAKDIKASASIIVLGKKVTKIAAKAFKGKKATILVVKSTKLKKAKIKNCLKGSKITVVQVPSSKKKAYKKIFTKKVAGKKVTLV